MAGTCPSCAEAEPDDPICGTAGPNHYACTRAAGHPGHHAACGITDHPILIWENRS